MSDQPEALRVATKLDEDFSLDHVTTSVPYAARLLREQHAEIEALRYHLRTITFSAELVQNYVAQLDADCEEARKEVKP